MYFSYAMKKCFVLCTGMLLEQHKDVVLQLLSDPKLLEEHVNLALKTLKEFVAFYFDSCPHIQFIL